MTRADAKRITLNTPSVWFVYIVRCADGTLYTGITTDVAKRLRQHNGEIAGGAKYTKGRGPCVLAWKMKMIDQRDAASLEYRIKQMPRLQKEYICTV